jgi:site-specific DNA-methyltransferase (adenine-specific)
VADKLTDEERRRFIVEDNVGFGDWDWDKLSAEFEKEELEDWGLDIDKNWKEDDIIEDEVPEVTENPVSKLGEVYQLGRHRIMCGDSTKIEDVEKLMDGKKADMLLTDPPYGMNFDIKNDDNNFKDVFVGSIHNAYDFSKKENWYIFSNFRCFAFFQNEIEKLGVELYEKIVWVKNLYGQGKLYNRMHEDILFCGSGSFYKIDKDVDVWNEDSVRNFGGSKNANEALGHPTQKPVNILVRAIKNSSKNEDIVLDLFLGSGSTLIACEQTNRICYGMEIDCRYIDVIRKRYAKFIGKEEDWESATPKIL